MNPCAVLSPSPENDYELPRPPRNLPNTELDADTIKQMISQASQKVHISLRYLVAAL